MGDENESPGRVPSLESRAGGACTMNAARAKADRSVASIPAQRTQRKTDN
jgi:hypothetical protein